MRAKFGLVIMLMAGAGQIAWAQTNPSALPPPRVRVGPPIAPSAPPPIPMVHNDPLRPIAKTHTMPPYPPDSFAAEEQGSSMVEVHINTTGAVDGCSIVHSSGYARLDQAACDHIAANWRWQPPTLNGVPTAARTVILIRWNLQDAQPPQ